MRVTAPETSSRFKGQSGEVLFTYTEIASPGFSDRREIAKVRLDSGVETYFVLKDCKVTKL